MARASVLSTYNSSPLNTSWVLGNAVTDVLGVDSSTQSCKVLRVDPDGHVTRTGRAAHPPGTEVHPEFWWQALLDAFDQVGGHDGVTALSIAGQQHGMVLLDESGDVVRPALLWNDTRSAAEAQHLIDYFGAEFLTQQTGSRPVAALTSTKLLWVRNNEPELMSRIAAVCLPHDYLSWRLSEGYPNIATLFTDRSDASGTGYFNPSTGDYVPEILDYCIGHPVVLPTVVDPFAVAACVSSQYADHTVAIGPGLGDNAAASLGLGLEHNQFAMSLGTSGTIFGPSTAVSADVSGEVSGFADGSGVFLPLVCTLNAAQVIDWGAALLGVGLDEFSDLALSAPPGAGGLRLTPHLVGERTPNLPDATGTLEGITLSSGGRENFARACVEGVLSGMAYARDALVEAGHDVSRIVLIGGAASSPAVQDIARQILGGEVSVAQPAEYVALGAAKQARAIAASGDYTL
jgi:xylulokinase